MIFSLLNVTSENADGSLNGYWVQDHVGTLETAQAKARATEAVNGNAITVCIIPSVNTVTPMLEFFTNQKKLG